MSVLTPRTAFRLAVGFWGCEGTILGAEGTMVVFTPSIAFK